MSNCHHPTSLHILRNTYFVKTYIKHNVYMYVASKDNQNELYGKLMNSRVPVKKQFGGSGTEPCKDERWSGSSAEGRMSLLVF